MLYLSRKFIVKTTKYRQLRFIFACIPDIFRKKITVSRYCFHWFFVNPFQPTVAFHTETSHFIYNANQMTGYYMNAKLGFNGLITIFNNLVAFFQTCKTSQITGNSFLTQSSPGVIFEEKKTGQIFIHVTLECLKNVRSVFRILAKSRM